MICKVWFLSMIQSHAINRKHCKFLHIIKHTVFINATSRYQCNELTFIKISGGLAFKITK